MNIAYFLTPKRDVAYLYDSVTVRQGLDRMRRAGYTAIPVISRDGQYMGTVSEGDFLWQLLPEGGASTSMEDSLEKMDQLHVRDILCPETYPPVAITVSLDEMFQAAMNQNFVPVVDDLGSFIGIVKRKDILRYFIRSGAPVPAGSFVEVWDNSFLRCARA